MLKKIIRQAYHSFPFSFKFYFRDIAVFFITSFKGAHNIHKIIIDKEHSEVCVLGNGPSLKADKLNLQKLANKKDFVCVNNFCDDELYTSFKPKLYVFLDEYFFNINAHPDWVIRRIKTFKTLNDKTSWKMKIVVPYYADVSILKEYIKNENIEIIRINTQSFVGNKLTKSVGKYFDLGIYGPPQINVLIYAIYLSIIVKYEKIHVFGADMSFHNDVSVDQESNELFITFRHFNEEDKREVLKKNPDKITSWKMAELLELSANTFYAHEIMNQYATEKGISIYNCSEYSLIDSYRRKKIL